MKRLLVLLLVLLLLIGIVLFFVQYTHRFQTISSVPVLAESAEYLQNPARGFYRPLSIMLKPWPQDYQELIHSRLDLNHALAMVQVNLQFFRISPLPDEAIQNLKDLFSALSERKQQYLVRFCYDWDGQNLLYEPAERSIIEQHMTQIGPVLNQYASCIFAVQGLFVGNWGEMNNSAYLSSKDLTELNEVLRNAVGDDLFFSVRTPAQWRIIQQKGEGFSGCRMGLYNDGMLGSILDTGTYNQDGSKELNIYSAWNRQEELDFQNILCRYAPNGGEVIIDNPYNDFENAVSDLASMHVTYLNEAYDQKVHQKWKDYTITEPGCYEGMSGYDYIERHLGYRYLLDSADFQLSFLKNKLHFTLNLKNVGFAPIYSETKLLLTLKGNGSSTTYALPYDARTLAGGRDAEQLLPMQIDFPLDELEPGTYRLYFRMNDASGDKIKLANTNHDDANGIYVGSFTLERSH